MMKQINGTVNWGIIGCGDVCEVKSGPAFNNVNNSRLVAVMRRNLAKAEDYAKRHHVPVYYNNASALINDEQVNAIYIATPPSSHEMWVLEALKAGKPVYVEKPVTLNAASCERLIDATKQYNGNVSVAHYRRDLPLFKKVKALIHEGVIGRVRLIQVKVLQPGSSKLIAHTEGNWRLDPEISGGGLFHDLSPHLLDILYWIFGEPEKVYGHSLNQAKQYAAPDFTMLEALFPNNVYLNSVWAFNVAACAADDSCEIIGDRGKLRFSFFRKSAIEIVTEEHQEFIEMENPVHIQQPMIDKVVKFFSGQGPNPCSLEEALVTLKMMDKTLDQLV